MTLADRIVVLRSGNVEQIGSPAELYRNPATAFVASFIGSPAMNLVSCAALPETEGLRISVGPANTIALPFRGPFGPERPLLLGIRPEELELCDPHAEGPVLRGTVDVVEPLGADTMVVLRVGDQSVTVRVKPSTRVMRDDVVGIAINPQSWSIFDAATEQAIHHA